MLPFYKASIFIAMFVCFFVGMPAEAARSCMAIFVGERLQSDIWIHGKSIKDTSDPTSRNYHQESKRAIGVLRSGTADLNMPFISIRDESLRFLELRPKDGIPTALLGPSVSVAIFRNPAERLKHEAPFVEDNGYMATQGETTGKQVQENFSHMLTELYASYSKQGVEVKSDIEAYRKEDLDNSSRSTHFVLSLEGRPFAHVQALHATGAELLNVEKHFSSFRVPRRAEAVMEIGRLRVLNAEASPILSDYYGAEPAKRAVGLLLYQKLMSWLNWDLKQSSVVMHVNESVRRVLMHSSSPLIFDTAEPVVGPTGVREWALTASRASMLKSEENLMRALLLARAERLKATSQPHGPLNHFALNFPRNELDVLMRLGLLSTDRNDTRAVFRMNPVAFAEAERGFYVNINSAALDRMIQTLRASIEK